VRPKTGRIAFIAALLCSLAPLAPENRTALLIANGSYASFGALANPVPEARQLKGVLEALGFEVRLVENAGKEAMVDALADFEDSLKARGGVAFFHYGGHGVQAGGRNYLVPVDADIPDERRLGTRALDVDEVMASMDASGAASKIIILDACRNNPLPGAERSATRGLAVVGVKPKNSVIVYSAQSGSVAQDGLFTPALTRALALPGLGFSEVLMRVRAEVYEASGGRQITGEYSELFSPIDISSPGGPIKPPNAGTAAAAVPAKDMVAIAGGTFFMGSNPTERGRIVDEPRHRVTVKGFLMGKREVTLGEWNLHMGDIAPAEGATDFPICNISWEKAAEYCNRRSVAEGLTPCYSLYGQTDPGLWTYSLVGISEDVGVVYSNIHRNLACDFSADGYRLPTEAEWEYACRAGTQTATAFGDDPTREQINFGSQGPFAAGSMPPNAWGLYDMHGNVKEWCWDPYAYYLALPRVDIQDHSSPAAKVVRGGGWDSPVEETRSAYRSVSLWSYGIGFRVARGSGE